MSRPFHPSELSGAEGYEPTSADLADALDTARGIETAMAARDVHPSTGFVDRVMGAIAEEPRPQPAVAAGQAIRRGRLRAMAAALGDSWRVAFSGGRPLAVRAQAAAFVLVAILAFGSLGGLAAVGAVRLLQPAPTTAIPASPSLAAPTSLPTPSVRPAGPTATPEPTPTGEPTETPEPTDTKEPGDTPDPGHTPGSTKRETPEPPETPEPTETEPSGGGGSGGGGGDS